MLEFGYLLPIRLDGPRTPHAPGEAWAALPPPPAPSALNTPYNLIELGYTVITRFLNYNIP